MMAKRKIERGRMMGTLIEIKEAIARLSATERQQLLLELNREAAVCAYGYVHQPNQTTLDALNEEGGEVVTLDELRALYR